jgi:hypothetical protein
VSGSTPYNPLEKLHLAQSIVGELFKQQPRKLSDTGALYGAGIYALYYTGPFEPYVPIASLNMDGEFKQPIYVGKAIPKGGRKGGLSKDSSRGDALRSRLRIHAASIAEVDNLNVEDFSYRALVVDDIWIPLGENAVIEWFKPVWNVALDGFGIKVPGKGRSNQRRSEWDTVHPGRQLAGELPPNSRAAEQLLERIYEFLHGNTQAISPEAADVADDGEDL